MSRMVVGQNVKDIFSDFGVFWRKLTSESQLRWVGPEKGVVHLATAAIINDSMGLVGASRTQTCVETSR
uniref:Uncharacterized protein n=1 Tax=Timema cristinae TaxID=61476 RepID=A0A7R9H238_TIMCR|nr:unnamed protein product [Timema cristinae]